MDDDDFRVRPGRQRQRGSPGHSRRNTLRGRVLRAARKGGLTPLARGGRGRGTGRHGRGRAALLRLSRTPFQRRVVVKARIVRHQGARFRAAPLARHVAYLKRDGVTRDGAEGRLFDARSDNADGEAFANRCEDDRHHFRLIVSPEDGVDMADLRAFTRELLDDVARDLGTSLDWVAVDHWNTDNPHVHVLLRGKADDGQDLVIDRGYVSDGIRARAEARVTLELGPRSERDIAAALQREVDAERWTSLDQRLVHQADAERTVDLRPDPPGQDRSDRALLLGRAATLERMGLAEHTGPATWQLAEDLEPTLRDLALRGDIIKTMHRALAGHGWTANPARFALHAIAPPDPVIGRLVARGLHDELTGEAYAVIDGTDGRTHHLRLPDLERTGDSAPGSIVELRRWQDRRRGNQLSLAVRSDLDLAAQVEARGATWLDRQLVAREPVDLGGGFGREVAEALERRKAVLADQGLATREGERTRYAPGLIDRLTACDLAEHGDALGRQLGRTYRPSAVGEHVVGTYRERVSLASGRFALIESASGDGGLGFQLVPWRPELDSHVGQTVTGRVTGRGGVDWSFGRSRGLSL